MDFIFKPPSLQHLALMKISATLWIVQPHIWARLAETIGSLIETPFPDVQEDLLLPVTKFEEIKDDVEETLWALPSLPEALKNRVHPFLEPIGQEMYMWFRNNCAKKIDALFHNNFQFQLCWSARGTIDSKKTAELLVKNEDLCIKKRYELACVNCLESDIRQLFARIPKNYKMELLRERASWYSSSNLQLLELTSFWAWMLTDKVQLEKNFYILHNMWYSFYQRAYYFSVDNSPLSASEYFFEKLSLRTKYKVLVRKPPLFPENHLSIPVIISYLSQISQEQKERYFEVAVGLVLQLFLNWPWQSLFLEAAEHLWRFMNQDFYDSVMGAVLHKISRCCRDYDYFHLFREFCLLSPAYFQGNSQFDRYLMAMIFSWNSRELYELIRNEANDEQKERFESSRNQDTILRILMDERIVSKETLMKCRTNFELEYIEELNECQPLVYGYKKHMRFIVLDIMVQIREIIQD